MESWFQDVRFALRTLRRRPLFAGVSVITLGLGIGATTAMFSVVDGVLLQSTPFRHSGRTKPVMFSLKLLKTRSAFATGSDLSPTTPRYSLG